MKRKLRSLVFIIFSFLSFQAIACETWMESLPILQNGRIKPLYVHAKETLRHLTGKSSVPGISSVEAYCRLSLSPRYGIAAPPKFYVPAEHIDLKRFLEIDPSKSTVLIDDVDIQDLRVEIMKQKEETSYKKALTKLFTRAQIYKDIKDGNNWVIPIVMGDAASWTPVSTAPFQNRADFNRGIRLANEKYLELGDTKHLFELKYAKIRLPQVALIFSLLALAALTLFKGFKVAAGLTFAVVLLETALLVARVYISGRAPVTNMYETVLFSGYGALILAMILGYMKRDKTFLFVGLGYNILCLFMMTFAVGMLTESLSPLVPVLRDNFWLSTHVTSIIISYGALALSWVLANTVLIKRTFVGIDAQDERYYADLIYLCIKIGSVLLAGGIILGGVWADYSWGRFWGWDPKETWSLIVLLIYIAILHGRYTEWIPNSRFIPLVALSFLSVMMAWFGVNYILASGLHSYGFSEGGAIFLGSFFAIQFVISIATWFSSAKKKASA